MKTTTKTAILLLTAAMLAVPTVSANVAAGPLGTCSGVVDAYCHPPADCPDTGVCIFPYCIVWVNGACPLTDWEVNELINAIVDITTTQTT